MPIGHEDILKIAEELVRSNNGYPSEAQVRSSISRAYYAAYSLASQKRQPVGFRTGSSHSDVWALFKEEDEHGDTIEFKGNALKSMRTTADYYLTRTMDRNDAISALTQARILIILLDKLI